jgi:hypothetical protein
MMSSLDAQVIETRKLQIEEVCRFDGRAPNHGRLLRQGDHVREFRADVPRARGAHAFAALDHGRAVDEREPAHREGAPDGFYFNFIEEGMIRGSVKDTTDAIIKRVNGGVMTPTRARGAGSQSRRGSGQRQAADPGERQVNLLKAALYDPAGAVSKATSSLLAMTAFDTANLRLAITVPAHGMVRFKMRVPITGATTCPTVLLGVLNGATVIGRVAPTYENATANAASQSKSARLKKPRDRVLQTAHGRGARRFGDQPMRKYLLGLIACLATSFAFAVPLAPVATGTKTISCTSSSAATALAVAVSTSQMQLELQNAGSATIFIEVGTSGSVAAVASGYPILAGQSKVITINSTVTHVACIVASATQTLYVTLGVGE